MLFFSISRPRFSSDPTYNFPDVTNCIYFSQRKAILNHIKLIERIIPWPMFRTMELRFGGDRRLSRITTMLKRAYFSSGTQVGGGGGIERIEQEFVNLVTKNFMHMGTEILC